MIGLFTVRSSQPFVKFRILWIDRHCLLRTLHGRIPLLHLQVTLRQQQVHVTVLRLSGCRRLQRLDGLGIFAGFVSAPSCFEACFLLHSCRCHRPAREANGCEQPLHPPSHSISPEKSTLRS